MGESKKVGPDLIASILMKAVKPLTTKELQLEVHRRVPFCLSDNVVALNVMRVSGTIKGKSGEERPWV